MFFRSTLLWTVVFFFHLVNLYSQPASYIRLSGQVLDSISAKGLANVHIIGAAPEFVGTVTNLDGSFSLLIPKRLDTLRFSHLGYDSESRIVSGSGSADTIRVLLKLSSYELPAATIKPRDPLKLVRTAINAIPRNYTDTPFKTQCFYREIIRDTSDYLSVAEAVFERAIFPGEDKKDEIQLKLVQGRASEGVKATRLFEDFHPSGGPNYLTGLELATHVPTFLQEKYLDKYEYWLEDLSAYDDRAVYIIRFDQKEGVKESLNKGRLYIDTESAAIIRFTSSMSPRGTAYVKHLSGTDKLMAKLLKIEFLRKAFNVDVHFRAVGNQWYMNHAQLEWAVGYSQPKKELDLEFTIQSDLIVTGIDTDVPEEIPRVERWDRRQLILNLPTAYNEGFWGVNNYIEPSRAVDEIITGIRSSRSSYNIASDSITKVWTSLKSATFKVMQDQSDILLQPLMRTSWKNENSGPFLYQTLDGDFTITAKVQICSWRDTTQAPSSGFQQGGIMVRNPMDNTGENYLFFGLGTMGNPKLKIVENSTHTDKSAIRVEKSAGKTLALKIVRKGPAFEFFMKPAGTPNWIHKRTYERSELAGKLQVGPAAFTHFNGNGPKMRPDLLVRYTDLEIISTSKIIEQ